MLKKRAFTLLEMMLVVIASGTLISVIFSVLTTLPKVKVYNDARQTLIQQTNDIMNRFSTLFQDYTIDYEEYFNRKMVGCNYEVWNKFSWKDFKWNTETYINCRRRTSYWNRSSRKINEGHKHNIKYCSNNGNDNYNIQDCTNGTIPIYTMYPNIWEQPYWQYKALFRDIGEDTDNHTRINKYNPAIWDADDQDLGNWPIAVGDANNVKELYLISHDKNRRILLRRKIEKDWENKVIKSTIQILKLRGFDAWDTHIFEKENSTVFDWEIDTWACDAGEWFKCNGSALWLLYPNYKLPKTVDDWRIDLFPKSIFVEDFTLTITPTKDPNYAWNDGGSQKNPYIKISITTKLNPTIWEKKLGNMLKDYTFTLQSSFDTKWFYLQ